MTADASVTDPLPGSSVMLIGTAEDRDGDAVTPTWTQFSGPTVSLLPNRNSLSPRFTAPSAGTLVFDLVGNDGFADGAAARVTVIVDEKPTAVATATPPDGIAGTSVTIDGSQSSDPENADLTFAWTQTAGTSVSFDGAAESFQVTAPAGGMTFRLVVNDGRQDSDAVVLAFSNEQPPTPAPTSNKTAAAYGASVQLSANPSDDDPATFTWKQVNSGADPVVSLSSTTAENPSFTVPLPTSSAFGSSPSATFGVIATRAGKSSQEKTVVVTFFASYNDSSVATASRVYGIVSRNCTSCHRGTSTSCPVGSGGTATGFGMASANAFASNSIAVNACRSSKKRVAASSSANSYLIDRLNGSGGSMPPSGMLSATKRNLIKDWVDQGASTTR